MKDSCFNRSRREAVPAAAFIEINRRNASGNHTMIPDPSSCLFHFVPDGKPSDFWFISAWNPGGKSLDAGINVAADDALHRLLADEANQPKQPQILPHFRILRTSCDEQNAEQGWGIACTEARALAIAKLVRCRHIYRFGQDAVELCDLKRGGRCMVGAPGNFIRDPRAIKYFTLFVGSPAGHNRLDPLEYAGVCTRTGAYFPGFTIQRAEGCFQSRFEDTVLIHIATREPQKLLALAHELRCFLNQIGVGISHKGIYQRVCDWSDDSLILESFGL